MSNAPLMTFNNSATKCPIQIIFFSVPESVDEGLFLNKKSDFFHSGNMATLKMN